MKMVLGLCILGSALLSSRASAQEVLNYVGPTWRLDRFANGSFVKRRGQVYFRLTRHNYDKIGRRAARLRIRDLSQPNREVPLLYENAPVIYDESDLTLIPVRAANPGHIVLKERGRALDLGETLFIVGYHPGMQRWLKIPATVEKGTESQFALISPRSRDNVILRYAGITTTGMSGSPVLDRFGNLVGIHQGHFRNQNKTPTEYLVILKTPAEASPLRYEHLPEIFPSAVYDATNPFNSSDRLLE